MNLTLDHSPDPSHAVDGQPTGPHEERTKRRGERDERLPARGLRAMVPVNVRDGSDQATVGNRVSSLFVDLAVAEPLAILRLRAINAQARRLKSSGAAIFSYDGRITFGVNGDAGSMHDLDVLARGIEEGSEELRRVLSHNQTKIESR